MDLHECGRHGFELGRGCGAVGLKFLSERSEFLLYLLLYMCGYLGVNIVCNGLFDGFDVTTGDECGQWLSGGGVRGWGWGDGFVF